MNLNDCNTEYTLETTCRICLNCEEAQTLIPLFSEETTTKLSFPIELIRELKLRDISENDGLPQNICTYCMQQLSSFSEFHQMYKKSQEILKVHFLYSNKEPNKLNNFVENADYMKIEPESSKEMTEFFEIIEISEEKTETDGFEDLISSDSDDSESYSFKCENCGNVYNHLQTLDRHKCTKSRLPTNKGVKPKDEPIDANSGNQTKYRYRKKEILNLNCRHCNTEFKDVADLIRHTRSYHPKHFDPLTCVICEKSYSLQRNCQMHMKLHNTKRRFVCPDCGMGFFARLYLKRHCVHVHKKLLHHMCSLCEMKFKTFGEYRKHVRSHNR